MSFFFNYQHTIKGAGHLGLSGTTPFRVLVVIGDEADILSRF